MRHELFVLAQKLWGALSVAGADPHIAEQVSSHDFWVWFSKSTDISLPSQRQGLWDKNERLAFESSLRIQQEPFSFAKSLMSSPLQLSAFYQCNESNVCLSAQSYQAGLAWMRSKEFKSGCKRCWVSNAFPVLVSSQRGSEGNWCHWVYTEASCRFMPAWTYTKEGRWLTDQARC